MEPAMSGFASSLVRQVGGAVFKPVQCQQAFMLI